MSDEAAFLMTIHANLDNETARLDYADWLDEHGRPGGAFLRAECALSALEPTDPRRAELQASLRDAGAGVDPRWVATVTRAPIENCPPEFQSRCPKRWELLSPLRSEAARGCGQEAVFCCSIGMAQARTALGYRVGIDRLSAHPAVLVTAARTALTHRVAIDPRLARTPRDLESNPDDVTLNVKARLIDDEGFSWFFGALILLAARSFHIHDYRYIDSCCLTPNLTMR
jgi:uncharacterized protein (TIGR02996 family)